MSVVAAADDKVESVNRETKHKIGLVLSGGGARGAYQSGVLKAVTEITRKMGIRRPLPIITGVSAGAINASYLAATADDLVVGAQQMADIWSKITADQIFRTDALSAGRSGLRLLTDATIGAFYKRKLSRSLLDTAPLRDFLLKTIPFERISSNVESGFLTALGLTAMSYSESNSITFVHGRTNQEMWTRSRRKSERAAITAEHVMASSAIPLFFPPIRLASEDFGDGCLRNTAPLSPAIHLGAEKLLVISVRKADSGGPSKTATIEPSFARVLGVILNALLLDAIDVDMERMSRINSTISMIPAVHLQEMKLRPVEYLWLRPSEDIGELAGDLFERLPKVIRYLVGGLGSSREASELTSYLLFDPDFCGQLVSLGYRDGYAQREAIEEFFQ